MKKINEDFTLRYISPNLYISLSFHKFIRINLYLLYMGYKQQILVMLTKENLTSHQLSLKLGIDENNIRVYLNRLKDDKKIQVIDKKERYKVYSIVTYKNSKKDRDIQRLKYILNQFYILFKFKFELKQDVYLLGQDHQLLKNVRILMK